MEITLLPTSTHPTSHYGTWGCTWFYETRITHISHGSRLPGNRAHDGVVEHGKDGDCAINISPAGNSYLGKICIRLCLCEGYIFFPMAIEKFGLHNIKYGFRTWIYFDSLPKFMLNPAHTQATEFSLTRLFLQLPQDFSEESMLQIAHQLPQQQIPPEYEEVSLKHSEAFQKNTTL